MGKAETVKLLMKLGSNEELTAEDRNSLVKVIEDLQQEVCFLEKEVFDLGRVLSKHRESL